MAVQADEQVLDVGHVAGNIAIEADKNLAQKQEHVDADGISHGLGQGLDLRLTRVEVGELADEQAEQDQQCRSGGKGGRQKTRRQNSGEPEMTAGQTAV
jgi:hypothetical protein